MDDGLADLFHDFLAAVEAALVWAFEDGDDVGDVVVVAVGPFHDGQPVEQPEKVVEFVLVVLRLVFAACVFRCCVVFASRSAGVYDSGPSSSSTNAGSMSHSSVIAHMVGAWLFFPYDGHVVQRFHELLGHRIKGLGDGGFEFLIGHAVHSCSFWMRMLNTHSIPSRLRRTVARGVFLSRRSKHRVIILPQATVYRVDNISISGISPGRSPGAICCIRITP